MVQCNGETMKNMMIVMFSLGELKGHIRFSLLNFVPFMLRFFFSCLSQ